jgi:hypothetical protein
MSKKYARAKRSLITALTVSVMLLTGTFAAYAAEVPTGVTEVKIPLALESESAIAGAEIAFRQSDGLEYVRFEPASGAENPIKATADGNTWIGFFSATNRYRPSEGVLTFGNLVFSYEGDGTEEVTIAETRLHSLTGVGSEVKSARAKPGTIILVTRQASGTTEQPTERNDSSVVVPVVVSTKPSEESGGSGTGSGAGSDKSSKDSGAGSSKSDSESSKSGNVSGSANATDATNTVDGASQGSSVTTTAGSVAIAESENISDETTEVAAMVPFSPPEVIAAQDIPLTDALPGQQEEMQGAFPVWWMAAVFIAGVLAGVFAVFVVMKRRRRKDAERA